MPYYMYTSSSITQKLLTFLKRKSKLLAKRNFIYKLGIQSKQSKTIGLPTGQPNWVEANTLKCFSMKEKRNFGSFKSITLNSIFLEIMVGSNTIPQNRLVRCYKHIVRPSPIRCEIFNTPSRPALLSLVRGHKWWVTRQRKPDNRWSNGSWRGSDTILEIVVGHNTTPQNRFLK